jgi:hypothetical protein
VSSAGSTTILSSENAGAVVAMILLSAATVFGRCCHSWMLVTNSFQTKQCVKRVWKAGGAGNLVVGAGSAILTRSEVVQNSDCCLYYPKPSSQRHTVFLHGTRATLEAKIRVRSQLGSNELDASASREASPAIASRWRSSPPHTLTRSMYFRALCISSPWPRRYAPRRWWRRLCSCREPDTFPMRPNMSRLHLLPI